MELTGFARPDLPRQREERFPPSRAVFEALPGRSHRPRPKRPPRPSRQHLRCRSPCRSPGKVRVERVKVERAKTRSLTNESVTAAANFTPLRGVGR